MLSSSVMDSGRYTELTPTEVEEIGVVTGISDPVLSVSLSDSTLRVTLFPLFTIRRSLLEVLADCDDPSESQSDEAPGAPDELKYWAAGPGNASFWTISWGVEAYRYECDLSWNTRYKM